MKVLSLLTFCLAALCFPVVEASAQTFPVVIKLGPDANSLFTGYLFLGKTPLSGPICVSGAQSAWNSVKVSLSPSVSQYQLSFMVPTILDGEKPSQPSCATDLSGGALMPLPSGVIDSPTSVMVTLDSSGGLTCNDPEIKCTNTTTTSPATITINTTKITINPGNYAGRYEPSWGYFPDQTPKWYWGGDGLQTFVIPKGMEFEVDSGAYIQIHQHVSAFGFSTDASGKLVSSSVSPAASATISGDQVTLTLNTVTMKIRPKSSTATFNLSNYGGQTGKTFGKADVTLIRGLELWIWPIGPSTKASYVFPCCKQTRFSGSPNEVTLSFSRQCGGMKM